MTLSAVSVFLNDGPLDMRMDRTRGQSAAEWLAVADEQDIVVAAARLRRERFARRIARAIVARRASVDQGTRAGQAGRAGLPGERRKHKHPATRTFQAIRIFINREAGRAAGIACTGSSMSGAWCTPGGDQLPFRSRTGSSSASCAMRRAGRNCRRGCRFRMSRPISSLRLVGKSQRAGDAELARNPRARSADVAGGRGAGMTRGHAITLTLLLLAVIASGIAVVYAKNLCARCSSRCSRCAGQGPGRHGMGRLQLGNYPGALGQVMEIAGERLQMHAPEPGQIVVVR